MAGQALCGEDLHYEVETEQKSSRKKDPQDIPTKWINYGILWFLSLLGLGVLVWFVSSGWWAPISGIIALTPLVYIAPQGLLGIVAQGEWLKSIKKSRCFFAIGFSLSFIASLVLSGRWPLPDYERVLPSVWLWWLHLHHWLVWSIRFLLFLPVLHGLNLKPQKARDLFYKSYPSSTQFNLEKARDLFYKKRSITELKIAAALAIFFVLTFFDITIFGRGLFPTPGSFRVMSGALTLTSIFLFLLLRSSATRALGFKRVMASFLGISLGVTLEGLIDAISDPAGALDATK